MKYCKHCNHTEPHELGSCSICGGALTRGLTAEELKELMRQSGDCGMQHSKFVPLSELFDQKD